MDLSHFLLQQTQHTVVHRLPLNHVVVLLQVTDQISSFPHAFRLRRQKKLSQKLKRRNAGRQNEVMTVFNFTVPEKLAFSSPQ